VATDSKLTRLIACSEFVWMVVGGPRCGELDAEDDESSTDLGLFGK